MDRPEKIDPRIADLEAMGLTSMWLRVAGAIGVDNFLELWRILDAHPQNYHDSGLLRISMRRYASYLRLQRNRYIEALYTGKVPLAEISKLVQMTFGENLTEVQLYRIGQRVDTRDYYRKRTKTGGAA